MGVYIVIGVIYSIVCGAIASSIASNRGMEGGFGWGFFLGIIGVIVVALRPSDRAVSAHSGIEPPARSGMQDSRDAQKPSDAKAQAPSKTAVFSLPNDLYAAGSPVILASGSLLKDRQTDAMSVKVALQNISPKPIIAAQIRVRPMDAAGRTVGEDIPCHYLDLNVKTGESFGGDKEFSLPDSTTREISVEVAEVIFSDKTVWQSGGEPWEPLPSPEPLNRKLGDPELVKQYRIRFGNASEIWPRAHKDLWLCACGTWNKEDGCYRCQREGAVLLALDPEELTAEKDARLAREKADREAKEAAQRAAAEKAAAEAAAREAAEKAAAEKRKRRNRRIALTLAIIAALGAGGYFLWTDVIQPNQQYKEAAALYDAGRYQEAIAAFEALDGYKDSAAQIKICETAIKDEKYATALELYNVGKYEEAEASFIALRGYKDSADQIEKCETAIKDEKYDAAVDLYNAGQYEEALVVFEDLDGYKDSAAQIKNCETAIKDEEYDAAVDLYNAGQYEEAIAVFEAIDGYKDSAAQIKNCETAIKDEKYDAAVDLYNAGQYEEALVVFEAIDGYKDSAAQIKKCETAIKDEEYAAATKLYNAREYEGAIAAFTALDGYKDSAAKIVEIKLEYHKQLLSRASVGSLVFFGSYEQDNETSNGKEDIEWLVLAKTNNRILVISKYVLDYQKYNDSYRNHTWENSSLREWLNGTFLNAAFSTEEQKYIISSTVTARNNPTYKTSPGKNTTDKIFLLSITEAEWYFGSREARECKATDYLGWKSRQQWWLRSPGFNNDHAAVVKRDGQIGDGGDWLTNRNGVRPAMWIDIG